jgi:simple sugar transport system permease protein
MNDTSRQLADGAASTRYKKMTWQRLLMRSSATNIGILWLLVALACALAYVIYPNDFNFFTSGNLAVLAQQIPIMGIVAVGVGFLMISGEFDLSVAGVYTAIPFVTVIAFNQWGLGFVAALVVGLACAVLVALVNSWVTLKLKVPSFIATLGMMFFLQGVVRWISLDPKTGQPGPMVFAPGDMAVSFFSGQIVGALYAQVFWLLVIGGAAALVLNRHFYGNHLLATGGDADAAQKTGIKTDRTKAWAFVICSCCAALAGIVQSTRIGVVSPASSLNGLELSSIAACVVGGVLLSGGRGNVLGMILGAALLVVVENLLVLIRAPGEYSPAFVGLLIILSVIFNSKINPMASGKKSK